MDPPRIERGSHPFLMIISQINLCYMQGTYSTTRLWAHIFFIEDKMFSPFGFLSFPKCVCRSYLIMI